MKLFRLFGATALAGTLATGTAYAQSTPSPNSQTTRDAQSVDPTAQAPNPTTDPAAVEAEQAGELVVTGSRIARPNLDSAVPVTAITGTQLTSTGTLSVGDELNRLPQLRSSLSQANSTGSIGTAGLNQLDLRGLGTQRTLVLVNGRRHVSSTPGNFAVDVNTIPSDLIERVDVVTGGSSSVYGSDAVSGVVNFVLKNDFEGLHVRGQGGVSSRGDRGQYFGSVIYGKNFLEDRGNLSVAVEYAHSDPLYFADRPTQTGAFDGVPGFYQVERNVEGLTPAGAAINEPPAGDGIPDNAFFGSTNGSKFGSISLGGVVVSTCPAAIAGNAVNAAQRAAVCTGQLSQTNGRLARNYVFNPDGSLVIDQPTQDLRPVGGGIFGGSTATGVEGAMLLPGLERVNVNVLGHMEVSSALDFFMEAKGVHIINNQTSTQPTFVNGTLSPTFRIDNAFLTPQAVAQLRTNTGNATTFTLGRFNNDIGTRAETHERNTVRVVGGVRGELWADGNLRYELSGNFGRTETNYQTGGNVDVRKFNAAADAARDPATGQIVCRINIDTNPNNNDPGCRPINLFGQNAPLTTRDALRYVLYTSTRNQWAQQIDAQGFISGDTGAFFRLPGGPIGFSFGGEYRKEDAYSDYDDFTQAGNTFLNAIAEFSPPAINVKEAFGELRIPLLSQLPLFQELTLEASGRVSDYNFLSKKVYAWDIGGIWAPIRGARFRVRWSRSVRAPTLSDLYGTPSQTFANNLVDPCSQTSINQNPNRSARCAEAGIPTTITLPDGRTVPWTNTATSGILGINSGNPGLTPERGSSFTVGGVFEPRFLPGFALTVDYYNIRLKQAIAGLTGQDIINRCYEDPVTIDNPYCASVFRRTSADSIVNGTFAGQSGRRFDGFPDFQLGTATTGFINQPFNYQSLETAGIDGDVSYTKTFGPGVRFNARVLVSWLEKRQFYTFISDPARATTVAGVLGDPEWRGQLSEALTYGPFDISWDTQYIGKQLIAAYEVQNSFQGRPATNADAYPFKYYPSKFIHDLQIGLKVSDEARFFVGVDNVFDTLPPYGLTGTGTGSAIFPLVGRYIYSGVRLNF